MYGLPMNYNPFFPHAPQQPTPLPDVPQARLSAATDVKAQYLSADGQRAYKEMSDGVRVFYWDEEIKVFGSSFPAPEGLPSDAVVLK